MKTPTKFLIGAASMVVTAVVTRQPEFLLPGFMLMAGFGATKRAERNRQVATSLEEMEKRLRVTEGELEFASEELNQLRVEREFDRQLLKQETKPGLKPGP